MVTVMVKYVLPGPLPRAAVLAAFRQAEPLLRGAPGLIRKYFCYEEPSHTGHSVYLREDGAAARACYDAAFMGRMRDKFGATPELRYLDTLLAIDNEQGRTMS